MKRTTRIQRNHEREKPPNHPTTGRKPVLWVECFSPKSRSEPSIEPSQAIHWPVHDAAIGHPWRWRRLNFFSQPVHGGEGYYKYVRGEQRMLIYTHIYLYTYPYKYGCVLQIVSHTAFFNLTVFIFVLNALVRVLPPAHTPTLRRFRMNLRPVTGKWFYITIKMDYCTSW